jgi:DHA3 family tetracycline resistance protein-like MFS transporter
VAAAPPPFRDRIGVLKPLRVRDFRLMWTGLAVSMVGDGVYIIALALLVLRDMDRSNSTLALVQGAVLLPQVTLILGAGVLADRLDRRHLMIAADAIRLVAIGTMGVLALMDALTIPLLIALAIVYGIGMALFGPAFSSIVPTIVPEDLLVEANSLGLFVRPVAMMFAGPLIGGLLVDAFGGSGLALLADAATFVVSAVAITLMRTRSVGRDPESTSSPVEDLREGFRFVRTRRWLWLAMVAATISLLCTWGPWDNLLPVVVTEDLGGSPRDLGIVVGAGGLASVIAAVVMAQRGMLPRRPVTVLYLSWALGMLAVAGFGIVTEIWQAMAVAFVGEGSITVLVVVWVTLIQRLVPPELLGRVFALDWAISVGGAPLSFAIVGPVSDAIGHDATLIWAGVLGGGITLAFMFFRGARDPERDGSLAAERSSVAA